MANLKIIIMQKHSAEEKNNKQNKNLEVENWEALVR